MTWKSLHIFCHDFSQQDDLILFINEYSKKLKKENLINKWFFIRYWEGGPHIRYRIKITQKFNDTNLSDLYLYINEKEFKNTVEKEKYYENHSFDGDKVEINQLMWYKNGDVVEIQYKPEYERYGGEKLIGISEKLFEDSSFLACELIGSYKNFSKRVLVLSVISKRIITDVLSELPKNEIKEILVDNINYWSNFEKYDHTLIDFYNKNNNYVEFLNSNIEFNNLINDIVFKFKKAMFIINNNLQNNTYVASVLMSHIHMLNNRVGVTPVYERINYKLILEEIENEKVLEF